MGRRSRGRQKGGKSTDGRPGLKRLGQLDIQARERNSPEAKVRRWLRDNQHAVVQVQPGDTGILSALPENVRVAVARREVEGTRLVLPRREAPKAKPRRPLSDKEKRAIKVRDFLRTMGNGGDLPHIVKINGSRIAFAGLSEQDQEGVAKVVTGQADPRQLQGRAMVFAKKLWKPTAHLRQ